MANPLKPRCAWIERPMSGDDDQLRAYPVALFQKDTWDVTRFRECVQQGS